MSWRDVAAPEEALRFSGAAGFLSLEVCDAAGLIFEAGSDGSRANGDSQADGASGAVLATPIVSRSFVLIVEKGQLEAGPNPLCTGMREES